MSDQQSTTSEPMVSRFHAAGVNSTLSIGGYLYIVISLVAFGTVGYMGVFVGIANLPENVKEPSAIMAIFYGYLAHLLILLIGVVCAFLGVRLLRSAGAAFERVIPRDDFPVLAEAIVQGKSESIDQYVRLSSLSGFTGTFTKLGLTGLPLTTVTLTLIFSILSLFAPSFLDFAKLTLGAFIGSFVQRQVERTAPTSASPPATSSRTAATAPPLPA